MSRQSDFYNSVYSTARDLGANDVQARLAAAQASEETGYGSSMVGNNLFGVKASSSYTGPSVSAGTTEEYNGQRVAENANFRSYDNFTQSVKDYLGVIQSNFPDAWNAENFSDAVKGLNTGVFGKYATNSNYANNIKSIDSKYGGYSYAKNPENVPTPFGPEAIQDDGAYPDDVMPMAEPNFTPISPVDFTYAQNPENVPTPYSPNDLTNNSLLSAFQPAPASEDPFSAILGGGVPVAPVETPTVQTWSDMAAAAPVASPPSYNVPASASLGTPPDLAASAAVSPDPFAAITAPQTPQNASLSGFQDLASAGPFGGQIASPSSRMGIAEPSFDFSRFDQFGPSTASIDASRFSTPAKTDRIGTSQTLGDMARLDPLAGAINPATNTASFLSPSAPADLSGFASAMNAQRQVPASATGVNSPEHLAMQQRVEAMARELAAQQAAQATPISFSPTDPSAISKIDDAVTNAAMNAPAFSQAVSNNIPSLSVPSVGMSIPQMSDAATMMSIPGIASAYTAQPAATPAEQAIANVTSNSMTPAQIGAYQQFAETALPGGITNLSGNTLVGPTGTATTNYTPGIPASEPTQAATIEGPATTPAVTQQTRQAVTTTPAQRTASAQPQQTSLSSRLSKAINPGSVAGGVIGGMTLGPLGSLLGSYIGNQAYQNGGFSFGGGMVAPTTQIPGGVASIGGIYGGAYAPGTYAKTSNGGMVTAQPGGWTSYTNPYGVTEAISPTGQISHQFGTPSSPASTGEDEDQDTV